MQRRLPSKSGFTNSNFVFQMMNLDHQMAQFLSNQDMDFCYGFSSTHNPMSIQLRLSQRRNFFFSYGIYP